MLWIALAAMTGLAVLFALWPLAFRSAGAPAKAAAGRAGVKDLVERLMGRNPEHRFMFIQNRAGDIDPDMIDA